MQIGINIDGQFKKMTGIQHYVDSLIAGLYNSGTEHEITAFAAALPSSDAIEETALKQAGTFEWYGLPQAHFDTATAQRRTLVPKSFQNEHPWFSTQIRIREERYLKPTRVTEAQRLRKYDLFHIPEPHDLRFIGYKPKRAVATLYDLASRFCAWAYEAPAIAVWERYFEYVIARCGHIVAISESTKQDVVEYLKISPDRITVTPLAARVSTRRMVDGPERRFLLSAWELNDRPFVLYTGTLEPRKNLERLVRAFAYMLKEDPSLQHDLVLAGGNWLRHDLELRLLACECGIPGRVITTGYTSNDTLNALMSSCSAFIYISKYEGFGMPPLEAMTCGAPVIVANTSSLPEVVGSAGLLVSPDDTREIASAMHKLLSDDKENERRRRLSLQQAGLFSWDRTAALTLKAYDIALVS